MKEQIFKIISKHYFPNDEELRIGEAVEEINSLVFEFIIWLTAFNNRHSERVGKGWRLYKTTDPIKEYSLEEVYNYWLKLKSSISMIPVTSSQIKSIGYASNTLYIEFHQGIIYSYASVPETFFEALKKAESVGKYFGSEIKGKFEFSKTDKVVVNNQIL